MQAQARRIFLPESLKATIRESSLDVASRILRLAGRFSEAVILDRVEPEAVEYRGDRALREVCALVMNEGALERSVRRASLRFAARKLRELDDLGVEAAAVFLEQVAADDSPGSFVDCGRVTAAPRHIPSELPGFPLDNDDEEDADYTRFLPRIVAG